MNTAEVDDWLSYLANERSVAINTQKTALNAVVFLYKPFNKTGKGRRLPTVISRAVAIQVLSFMEGNHNLTASLMYDSGLHFRRYPRYQQPWIGLFRRRAQRDPATTPDLFVWL